MVEEIKLLCEGLGWIDLGPQKHTAMISFRQEDTGRRCNIYFKNMTVAIQDYKGRQKYSYNVDLETLENLLSQ